MQPEHVPIGDLFSRECLYTVPLFQRPYVWNDDRWEALWEDVSRVADQELAGSVKIRPHFLGSVVLQQIPNGIKQLPRREIIDGQQRLTTLQLLLKASADAMEADGATSEAARPLRPLLRHPYAPKSDPEGAYKVWPTNVDRVRFQSVMDAGPNSVSFETDRLAGAYVYFRDQVTRWLVEGGSSDEMRAQRAEALATTLRQRLWLIALNLAEDDQAQVIFESLNARGTPLLPADLIKNFLLRQAEAERADTSSLYARYWQPFDEDRFWHQTVGISARPRLDLFMQHALTVQTREIVAVGQLYDAFVHYAKRSCGRYTAERHLADLFRLAGTARALYEADEHTSDRVLLAAARIREMDLGAALPFLLHLGSDATRDEADVAQACMWLESFLVRRTVCGLSANGYARLSVELLKAVADARPAAPVVATFLRRASSESTRWPDDVEFSCAWRSVPLYRTLKRSRLTMLLRALERELRDPNLTDPVPIPKSLHVEHVMPCAWQTNWPLPVGSASDAETTRDRLVHTIGNLTLLTQKLNGKLSNAAWIAPTGQAAKRPELKRHGLLMLNQSLADRSIWNEEAIADRGDMLFEIALRIWPRPA
ncbi:MAG TPA: DUF262 domain-containing HNH endonuclease family protein [Acetobacteraceae bacterium]|nr:DUF262 domain-containing HNH endonuclease family protein [Acetobacteraceae bacterium]